MFYFNVQIFFVMVNVANFRLNGLHGIKQSAIFRFIEPYRALLQIVE